MDKEDIVIEQLLHEILLSLNNYEYELAISVLISAIHIVMESTENYEVIQLTKHSIIKILETHYGDFEIPPVLH